MSFVGLIVIVIVLGIVASLIISYNGIKEENRKIKRDLIYYRTLFKNKYDDDGIDDY